MNCLASLLRLDVCSSDGVNFPVNSLAGVDADFFHRLQKSDEPNIQDLFNDVNEAASMLFQNEFNEFFYKKFNIHTKSETFGGLITPASACDAFAGKQGVNITANKTNYQKIFVKRLFFWASAAGNVTFEIWDADMSIMLDSITEAVTAGKNSIVVNRFYDSENIFVCYDGTVSIAFQTGSCLSFECCDGLTIRGAKSDVLPLDLTYSGYTYGLGASIELACEIDDLVCENSDKLLNAYIYAFGASLKQEQFQTKKVNRITVIKPEEAKESYDFYMEKLRKELQNFIKELKIPDGFCATCRPFLTNIQSV